MEVSGNRTSSSLQKRWRPVLLGGIAVLIIIQIVALSPSSLEEGKKLSTLERDAFVTEEESTLANGIPKGKIPEYSVDKFNYVSTLSGQKQWQIVAERAFLYNRENLVHARRVTAYLYNPSGEPTVVTGREAKYYMDQRDLEVYGDVISKFPDGFETHSEYLRYRPNVRKIEIPQNYAVKGADYNPEGQDIAFDSMGLDYSMDTAKIILPKAVKMIMVKQKGTMDPFGTASGSPGPSTTPSPKSSALIATGPTPIPNASPLADEPHPGVPDTTMIESDHCVIFRNTRIAHFTMDPKRPLDSRYVRITQPTMFTRSRRADLNYGDFAKILQYLVAYEDVLIKERGKDDALRYGTGGRADFDTQRDVIILREFPQVYQNNDTVTGDVIVMHRDTDIVEVEHSNAFSEGETEEEVVEESEESEESDETTGTKSSKSPRKQPSKTNKPASKSR